MYNLIRYYNQNRRKVWTAIAIIIAIMLFIRLLNYFTIISNERDNKNREAIDTTLNTSKAEEDIKYTSNKSAVKGSMVQNSRLEYVQNLLDSFIDNCNSNHLEEAYNMLTDECKDIVYPTLEAFKKNYYNNMFEGEKKIYSFENWYGDTYYLTLKEDILATGMSKASQNVKNDYITVVGDKLNIRSFIGSSELGKENTDKDITVIVKEKQTFMDYEIYNLNVKNDSDKTICLTLGDDSNDIYIQDKNNVKYGVVNNEIVNSKMSIEPGNSEDLSFKFYSSYISDKKIQRMVLKKLNLDAKDFERNNIYEYIIIL